MLSIVGRKAAPNGVERKSEGRSSKGMRFVSTLRKITLRKDISHTRYPGGYRPASQESGTVVGERVAIEVL